MHRILFVCLGNICRSPAAEGIFASVVARHGRSSDFLIDSAGLGGWHVGELPDRRMRHAGSQAGYNFIHHARQITEADFDHFDLIIGMDRQNIQALTHMARTAEHRQKVHMMTEYLQRYRGEAAIEDPYYGTDADFREVIRLLEDACQGLWQQINS